MSHTGVQKLNAFIMIDWNHQQLLIKTEKDTDQAYRFSQIQDVSFTQQAQTKTKKDLVTNVVLGDLLAGGLGAFVGMMSAGQSYKVVSSMQLVISLRDVPKSEERIELIRTPLKSNSVAYLRTIKNTQDTLNVLAQIQQ